MDRADLKILDPESYHRIIYMFVLILGYSRTLFAWFAERFTAGDLTWLDTHSFFGCIPKEALYDKLKHVIIRRQGKQVTFNDAFVHFSAYCATGGKPPRCFRLYPQYNV